MKLWGSYRVSKNLRVGTKLFDTKWLKGGKKPSKSARNCQETGRNDTIRTIYYVDPDYHWKKSKAHKDYVNGEEVWMIPVKDQKALENLQKVKEWIGNR
ncbi:hypothetical protein HNV12_11830 [Methanococcoides sp. SA1]|nr:hypothetical protein [Methanococcoides sp. SA1]